MGQVAGAGARRAIWLADPHPVDPGLLWTLSVAASPAAFVGYLGVRNRPRLDVKVWGGTVVISLVCLGGAALALSYVASKTGPELIADWRPEAKPERYVGRRAVAYGVVGELLAFSARVLGQEIGPKIVMGLAPSLLALVGGLSAGMAVMFPLVAPFAKKDEVGESGGGDGAKL